eukprot:scaffold35478_cov129-Isochrysis_galbana.AAC.2
MPGAGAALAFWEVEHALADTLHAEHRSGRLKWVHVVQPHVEAYTKGPPVGVVGGGATHSARRRAGEPEP